MKTTGDVFVQILAEVSGKPVEQVRSRVDAVLALQGTRANFDEALDDQEAEDLLRKLRQEKAGIRRWLEEGRRSTIERAANYDATTAAIEQAAFIARMN